MRKSIIAALAVMGSLFAASPAAADIGTPDQRAEAYKTAKAFAQNDCGRAIDWVCRDDLRYLKGYPKGSHSIIYVFAYGEDKFPLGLFQWRRCSTRMRMENTHQNVSQPFALKEKHKRCGETKEGSYYYPPGNA